MRTKAKTAFLLILLMLATQAGLAKHMIVHASETGSASSSNTTSDSHRHHFYKNHGCDLCLLSKAFSKTTLAADVTVASPLCDLVFARDTDLLAVNLPLSAVYDARGPPACPS